MQPRFAKFALAAAAATAAGSSHALATPFDARVVGADAAWVLHVDVEAVLRSAPGRHILDNPGRFDIDEGDLEELKREMGVDVRKDVLGVTLYGTGEEDNGVVVVQATAAVDNLVAKAREEVEDFTESNEDGRVFSSWVAEDGVWWVVIGGGRGPAPRTVLISKDRETIFAGLEVLFDLRAKLPADHALVRHRPQAGSLVYAAAWDAPAIEANDEVSHILEHARGGSIDIAEQGANFSLVANIIANDAESANNIVQMAQGLAAFVRMAAAGEPEAAPFVGLLQGVTINAEGETAHVRLNIPTAQVIQLLEHAADHHEDHGDDDDADDDDQDWDGDDADEDDHADSPHGRGMNLNFRLRFGDESAPAPGRQVVVTKEIRTR